YTKIDINHAAGGNRRRLSAKEAWETAQLVENEVVRSKIPKFMAWLDDEPIGDLDMMEDKVDNPCPQRIPMEVEPLDHTKLEDLGLNTRGHDLFLSSREIPSVDEPKPQLLPNFLPLDVNLGDKRGTNPPINPYRLDPGDGVRINPDGVARLYFTRRSLEVLRKFHWMTLGG
ncbi:hypothetical protein Tco_1433323, partial [Tanacetum coccineum]